MPAPLKTALPPDMGLAAGYIVRFNAISPTTGANVAGVKFTNAVLHVRSTTAGSVVDLASGLFEPILIRQSGAV